MNERIPRVLVEQWPTALACPSIAAAVHDVAPAGSVSTCQPLFQVAMRIWAVATITPALFTPTATVYVAPLGWPRPVFVPFSQMTVCSGPVRLVDQPTARPASLMANP